jgi:peptidyl-tRNA hydrolase, PTH2 family
METSAQTPKMVLVLRKDLEMSPGKAVAQGGHAVQRVLAAKQVLDRAKRTVTLELSEVAFEWYTNEEYKKVVLAAKSEAQLLALHEKAIEAGIPASLVWDNGLTEFNGVRTLTAMALGPAMAELIDPLTKRLQAYR